MKRPFVVLNMAMTADGKIATANRVVTSFGSRRDVRHLYELRATGDAVLCGAHTAGTAGVTLGPGGTRYQQLRRERGLAEFHLRVVVSGQATLSPDAEVFHEERSPLILLVSESAPQKRVARLAAAGARVARFGASTVDLPAALNWLSREHGVSRIVAEGGAQLNDALFRAHLIDEVHVTICPYLFGGRKSPTISEGKGFPNLTEALQADPVQIQRAGNELFAGFRWKPHRAPSDSELASCAAHDTGKTGGRLRKS